MTDSAIIEAAARALLTGNEWSWSGDENDAKKLLSNFLTAVAPHIEAAALEKAAKVAEEFPTEVVQVYARGPNDPPGNLTRWSKPSDIAAAIRALIPKDSGGGD